MLTTPSGRKRQKKYLSGLTSLVAETQLPLKVDAAPDHGRTALKFLLWQLPRCPSCHLVCKYDESEIVQAPQ